MCLLFEKSNSILSIVVLYVIMLCATDISTFSQFLQAECNFSSLEDGCCSNHISATVRKVHVQEGQVQMVIQVIKLHYHKGILPRKGESRNDGRINNLPRPPLRNCNNFILVLSLVTIEKGKHFLDFRKIAKSEGMSEPT